MDHDASNESERAKVDAVSLVRTKTDWKAIRLDYEGGALSQRQVAKKWQVSKSTLMKRAMREKWGGSKRLVIRAARKLEAELADDTKAYVRQELAPWIEEQKERITRRGHQIASRGLDRLDSLFDNSIPTEPKREADASRAASTWLSMARTSLGMTDNIPGASVLNMNVLCNQSTFKLSQDAT